LTLAFVSLLILGLIFTGLLISLYWKWFIIPIFGVKPITISQGLGLSLFISLFSSNSQSISSKNQTDFNEGLAKVVFFFFFYFAVGYILQFFIKNKYNK
jgi:hypothetical protein